MRVQEASIRPLDGPLGHADAFSKWKVFPRSRKKNLQVRATFANWVGSKQHGVPLKHFSLLFLALIWSCGGAGSEQQLIRGELADVTPTYDQVGAYSGENIVAIVPVLEGFFSLPLPVGAAYRIQLSNQLGKTLLLSGPRGLTICEPGEVHDMGKIRPRPADCPAPEVCQSAAANLLRCRNQSTVQCDQIAQRLGQCQQMFCSEELNRFNSCGTNRRICEAAQQALGRCRVANNCQNIQDEFLRRCISPCVDEARLHHQHCTSLEESCKLSTAGFYAQASLPESIGCVPLSGGEGE